MAAALDVGELGRLVQAADPAAFLVPPRLLRRVIRFDRKLTALGLRVPHRKTYVIGRDRLLQVVQPEELPLEPGRDLPPAVILIARPEPEKLNALGREAALVLHWRLLFHARVHLEFQQRLADQGLTPAAIRERIHRIGQVEFDEIRTVLRQEKFLLPPRDDRVVYEEFVAVYLELSFFAATLLPRYFPGIDDFARIDEIVAQDVDGPVLYARTRLAGAPDPVFPVDAPARTAETATAAAESDAEGAAPDEYRQLLEEAATATSRGNTVGAAIRQARAALRAPAELADKVYAGARTELARLAARLQTALHLEEAEVRKWQRALPALLDRAARGRWSIEARLLYDLQKTCVAQEREAFAPDLIGWLTSFFRRPLLRPLPHQPAVRAIKHLRRALRRLPASRLAEVDRHALSTALHGSLHHAEERLRQRIRPLIATALTEAGLRSGNLPEQVALNKVTEELLDRVVEQGRFSLGDLRDALSRNQLKLPDLAGVGEFLRGDALLRANRRLAGAAEGIYRYGEFYLRWLQRFSALAFGTPAGRVLTLFLALPFGAAFVALEGVQYVIHEVRHLLGGAAEVDFPEDAEVTAVFRLTSWPLVVGLGVFLLALIHIPPFRRLIAGAIRLLGRGIRGLVVDLPSHVLHLPLVRTILESWVFLLLTSYVLKPLVVVVPAWFVFAAAGFGASTRISATVATFLASSVLLNSRLARDLQEMAVDWLSHGWERLRDLLFGVFYLIQDVFKTLLEALDRLLYRVDEWLQYRRGERRLSLAVKIVLGPIWAGIAYVLRFILLLFIEPQVNPIKHFPVVTVAHKLLLPLSFPLADVLARVLEIDLAVARTIALIIIGKVPGVFGFLVWELKENWKLYEANRPRLLQPVIIGHHGETMVRLLRVGFHSGTLPRLYAKLRRAERLAHKSGNWRASRKLREALHHVEQSVRHFAERELVFLLRRSHAWRESGLTVGSVEAGSNRVRIGLDCPELGAPGMEISFEEQGGWLLAGVSRSGWLGRLPAAKRQTLETALAGLYKLAGVALVREQIAACFKPGGAVYDIGEEGLVVWPGSGYEIEAAYDLRDGEVLRPRMVKGDPSLAPAISRDRLLFADTALTWQAWVATWTREQAGDEVGELPVRMIN